MECCSEFEDLLFTYLDYEGDEEVKKTVRRHLEHCPQCRVWVEKSRRLDQLLITQAPSIGDGERFAFQVARRLPKKRSFQKSAAAILTAAAVLLLMWAHSLLPEPPAPQKKTTPDRNDLILARMELSHILTHLAETPDEELLFEFEKKTQGLAKSGWRVKNMLSSALKREEGDNLLTAIRLATVIPRFNRIIGAVPALITLHNKGAYPKETLNALAILDGPNGESVLGRALFKPEIQSQALRHLCEIEQEKAAEMITQFLLSDLSEELSSFDLECLEALKGMGSWGVDSIVRIFDCSKQNPAIVRALTPPDPAWTRALIEKLPKLKGSEMDAGISLASFLRITDTLEILNNRAKRSRMERRYPDLMAHIGGDKVILNLVDLYEGPVSKRERKGLAKALSKVFDLYPDELDYALTMVLLLSGEDQQDTLVEMLGKGTGRGVCKALGWFIKNSEYHAFSAALALAKMGSDDALLEANAIVNNKETDEYSRFMANAAVLHIKQYRSAKKDRFHLTENRFAKLLENFMENENP